MLDNCEHLVDAVAALADDLLSRCSMLTILATSREPLEVTGERVWQVAPLEVPREEIALAEAPACEAIALFLDRARSVRADFALTEENLPWIRQICLRLDGIPLALELAAVRVRHLSPEEIARRLDDRFQLLVARGRRSERRHQTLQAALDWSHDLLDEPSRALFRQLAVFPGSFSLEAAEGICGGGPLAPGEVLELLGALVDRSLVALDDGAGPTRYRLLETVREYATRKLDEAGERAVLRTRHADWFTRRAEQSTETLFAEGEILSVWAAVSSPAELAELDELDDLCAACEWNGERGWPPDATMLAIKTTVVLGLAGRAAEAIALTERLDLDRLDGPSRA